jgi:hypothetical protein
VTLAEMVRDLERRVAVIDAERDLKVLGGRLSRARLYGWPEDQISRIEQELADAREQFSRAKTAA